MLTIIIAVIIIVIIIVRSITILVDIDGTLLDASHDAWFHHCVSLYGYKRAVEMYLAIIDRDDLKINKSLLIRLYMLKACGFKLVIWTNRSPAQRGMTERNLGHHLWLFSDSIYGGGERPMKKSMMPKGWCHVIDNEPQNLVGTSNALLPTFKTETTAGVVPATLIAGRVPQKRRGPHSVTLLKGGVMAFIALILSVLVSTAAPGAVVDTQPTFEVVDVIDVESTQNEDTGMCPPIQTDSPVCPMTTVVGGMRVNVTRRNRKRLRALLGGKSPYRRVWSMMLCGGTYNVGYQANAIEEASWMREACAEIVCAIGGDIISATYESACQLAHKLLCVSMIGYFVYGVYSVMGFETEGAIAVACTQSILGWFALPNATSSGVLRQVTGGNSQTSSTLRVQYWVDDELKNITITSYGKCARDVLNQYLDRYKKIVANNNSGRKSLLESGGSEEDIPEMSFSPEDFAIGRALRAGPIPEFSSDPGFDPETAEGFVIETSAAGKFVCLDEVGGNYTRFDLKGDYFDDNRNIVDEWLGDSATLDVVTGEIAVVQGMSWEDISKVWAIDAFKDGSYNEKWGSKYVRKELLAHRMYATELDPTMVEHRILDMTDGFGMIEGPRELLMAMFPGVRLPGGVGFRMFDGERGLVKGRYRFKINNAIDHVVIWSDPRNIKGTIFRKGGEGILITYWEYSQRLKPATSGPQLLSQVQARNTAWARYFEEFGALNARASASRLLGAIKHGYLDSGLSGFESSDDSRNKTIALIRRDRTVERMLELGLPIATSSTLVFLLGKLLKRWSVQKRHFNTAAQCWNIYLPHSASGIVMAKSSRELLGRVDRKLHKQKVYWCPLYRELIIDDELYAKCDLNNDMGDEDGDMMFLWLVVMSGVLTVLLSRHPVGIGGFQFLKPEEVAVDYQFTSYKSSLGNEIDVPIAEIGDMPTSDKYKFEAIADLEDSTTPTKDSSWQEILEYEAAKRRNAVALGRAINNMTWRIGHGLPFTPIECQLIADASQSGGVNVATMKMLADIVTRGAKQRVNGQKTADRAMVAKFRMHKKCKKKGVAIVNGDFTKLIERSVKEHQDCHQHIMTMVETKGTGMRNIEPLVALCTENGVAANKERGEAMLGVTGRVVTNFTYAANPGIIKAMRFLQSLDSHEAAEIVLGAIVSLHENGEYDHPIFSCYQDELPADLLQHNIFGYLTAYLQDKMAGDDNQDPNPDGDGSNDDPEKGGDMDNSVSGAMDEHTKFEMLDNMNMGELAQHCRDNGVKGWSKYRSLAKKADLIRLIIDSDDGDDDNDNDPTPPNGGGVEQEKDNDMDYSALDTSEWEREQEEAILSKLTPAGDVTTQPETTDRPKHRLPLFYAGIGCRNTPVEIQKVMTKVAQFVDSEGWTLRSGRAKGADTAFESGATKKEIFTADSAVPQEAVDSVDKYHPNVPALNAGKYAAYARKLMARNWCQIFGSDRNQKISQFVVCWAKGWTLDEEGAVKDVPGGTGQAVRIAYANQIPVFHLGIEGHKEELLEYLKDWRSNIDQTAPAADEADKITESQYLNDFTVNEQNIIHDFAAFWYNDKFPGNKKVKYTDDPNPGDSSIDNMSFLNLTKAELIDFVDWYKNKYPAFESINTAPAADEAGRKEGDMNLPNVQIWCDGACRGNPGVGGWGVILDHPKKRLEICGGETNTTNNRMELTAAIEGLKALRMPAKVTVNSDSKYVVKGMAEWVAGWIKKGWRKADRKPVANKDLWIELVDLASKHEVTWEWVEGHTGNTMNEAADTLANQGADEVEKAGYCLLDLLFAIVALLFLSSVAALGGEAVFAAAPLFFRKEAMAPNCILKEAVRKAEKVAEVTFRALVKAEDKAEIAKAVGVAEAIQETSTAEWRCLQEWETAMESLWQASKDLDAGEAMTLKVTSVTKPRKSTGRDRCGKRRTHKVSGNDYIVCCEGCSPGYCPKSNNLIEPGDSVAFHWIG